MNVDDFRYMWRGQQRGLLPQEDANLLSAIDIRRAGRKRALLLLHGFSSTPAVYRRIIPKLTMYDAIVCPVLPGHGDTITAFSHVKAADWLATAEQHCDALLKQYEAVDVMGLSLGGLLACHVSKRFSLHHLYVLAPALALKLNLRLALSGARILHRLGVQRLRNRAGNLCTQQEQELAYRFLPIHAIVEILQLVQSFEWSPPDCPTDVFLGCHDEVIDSQKVAKQFSNLPNVQIHWLRESAHLLPLDNNFGEIIAAIYP